jgi:hypothetical protein
MIGFWYALGFVVVGSVAAIMALYTIYKIEQRKYR